MRKALVLCGGGAKGSYQMGVWKCLEELNYKFDIACGTSIGCLNAAMYAQNEYEKCNELWNKISLEMIMEEELNYDENVAIRNMLKQKTDLLSFVQKFFKNRGADITPFKRLMDEYIDENKIKESNITLGIVSASFPTLQPIEVVSNDLQIEQIKPYILASVSCFPIFPICKIDDLGLIDGGYYDNLPINFALSLGADEVVAVDLDYTITHKEFMNKPYVKYIKPSWNLGGFMRFERDQIENNRILGYNDCQKSYGLKMGFRYTFNLFDGLDSFSRRYILYVAKIVGKMRLNKIKTNVKPEQEGDIFHLLEKHTFRPLTDNEYYIRAIEMAAEFFGVNYLPVYDISEMFDIILDEINQINDDMDLLKGYDILKKGKQKDFISRINDRNLIKYLYNYAYWDEDLPSDLLMNILACKPIVFCIYVLMKIKKVD